LRLAVGTVLVVLVTARSLIPRFEPVVEAVQGEIVLKPPLEADSGSGSFNYLDAAINDNEFDAPQSALSVSCAETCQTEFENVAVWQGFPNGAEPLRLEVSWNGVGGIPPAVQAQAYFLLEYDIADGWETGLEDLWVNSIPACSAAHPARCTPNVYVKRFVDPFEGEEAIQFGLSVKFKNASGREHDLTGRGLRGSTKIPYTTESLDRARASKIHFPGHIVVTDGPNAPPTGRRAVNCVSLDHRRRVPNVESRPV
jgi:hypothetical protein